MHQESKSRYNSHLIKLIVAFVVFGVAAFFGRQFFIPETMGQYGHYRGSDIEDQRNVPIKLQSNEACFDCHKPIRKIHKKGVHKTVSCEICHGPYGNHIKDDKKIGVLPVKRDAEITQLCLRCHNKIIQARPRESIKVVGMPEHLEEKKVQITHNCNQCHMVHAPLLWVNQAKEMMGMAEVK